MIQDEVTCTYCKRTFYLNSFRLREAKTVTCLYCGKRFNKNEAKASGVETLHTPPTTEVVGIRAGDFL